MQDLINKPVIKLTGKALHLAQTQLILAKKIWDENGNRRPKTRKMLTAYYKAYREFWKLTGALSFHTEEFTIDESDIVLKTARYEWEGNKLVEKSEYKSLWSINRSIQWNLNPHWLERV